MTFLNGAPVNTAVHEHENLHAGKEKWKSNFPIVSELVKGMTVFLEKPWTIASSEFLEVEKITLCMENALDGFGVIGVLFTFDE